MELLKKLFKDEDRIIGLCGFKKAEQEQLRVFIPKFDATKSIYNVNYQKNFFLM